MVPQHPGGAHRAGARQACCFTAQAEPVSDPQRIADFLQVRLQRRPRMIGAIMRLEGMPGNPDRRQLEAFAAGKVMVVIKGSAAKGQE